MKLLYVEYTDGSHDFFDLSFSSTGIIEKVMVDSKYTNVVVRGVLKGEKMFNCKEFLKGSFD